MLAILIAAVGAVRAPCGTVVSLGTIGPNPLAVANLGRLEAPRASGMPRDLSPMRAERYREANRVGGRGRARPRLGSCCGAGPLASTGLPVQARGAHSAGHAGQVGQPSQAPVQGHDHAESQRPGTKACPRRKLIRPEGVPGWPPRDLHLAPKWRLQSRGDRGSSRSLSVGLSGTTLFDPVSISDDRQWS